MQPQLFGAPVYLICWAIGAVVGIICGTRMARQAGFSVRRSVMALCAAAVIIVVGSKLLFLAEHLLLPLEDPAPPGAHGVVGLLRHGFRIPGGIMLMVPLLPVVCWALGLPTLRFADAIFPAVGLATFFVRVGCLLNGCCFGDVTEFPLALTFPPVARVYQWQLSEGLISADSATSLPVHPLQVYFALLGLSLYLVGRHWQRDTRYDGQVWVNCNLLFFAATFGLEFLRPHPLRINLLLCSVAAASMAVIVFRRRESVPAVVAARS